MGKIWDYGLLIGFVVFILWFVVDVNQMKNSHEETMARNECDIMGYETNSDAWKTCVDVMK